MNKKEIKVYKKIINILWKQIKLILQNDIGVFIGATTENLGVEGIKGVKKTYTAVNTEASKKVSDRVELIKKFEKLIKTNE